MFVYDPDGHRHGEYKGANVIESTLFLRLKGFKTLRIPFDHPKYAIRELQNLAQAAEDGKPRYTLDSDHRLGIEPEGE